MINFFISGGPFMYPILVGSIAALAIFIERFFVLQVRFSLNHRAFLARIMGYIRDRNYNQAISLCEGKANHPLVKVLKAGIIKANKSKRDIAASMEEETVRQIPIVEKRVGYLAVIGNISTLVGLLGTIFGLIAAFEAVGLASAADKQKALADGISEAMATTAFGLIVAIPCMFAHYFLSNKANDIVDAMDESALALTNQIGSDGKQINKAA